MPKPKKPGQLPNALKEFPEERELIKREVAQAQDLLPFECKEIHKPSDVLCRRQVTLPLEDSLDESLRRAQLDLLIDGCDAAVCRHEVPLGLRSGTSWANVLWRRLALYAQLSPDLALYTSPPLLPQLLSQGLSDSLPFNARIGVRGMPHEVVVVLDFRRVLMAPIQVLGVDPGKGQAQFDLGWHIKGYKPKEAAPIAMVVGTKLDSSRSGDQNGLVIDVDDGAGAGVGEADA
jgi:hypothetical protein